MPFYSRKTALEASRPETVNLMLRDLVADYHQELRLAKQLRDHAAKAPYAHAERRLLELATAGESHAAQLKETIERLGGEASDASDAAAAPVRDGKNHWARLMVDLEDKQAMGARYIEQAIHIEDHAPEVAELLRALEREGQTERYLLRDMAARSDPQAAN